MSGNGGEVVELVIGEGEEVQGEDGGGANADEEANKVNYTEFFEDGKRRIDFVLVYQVREEGEDDVETTRRDTFLKSCKEVYGLEFESEMHYDGKKCFLKVHCPWEPLLEGAQRIGLRLPISDETLHSDPIWHATLFKRLCCVKDPLLPNIPDEFKSTRTLTAPFKVAKRNLFSGCTEENASTFITPAQRSAIVWDSLQQAPYEKGEGRYGVEHLIHKGSFMAAYPLHKGDYCPSKDKKITTERQLLYCRWARWTNWYKNQPLDQIRTYFGEKIAFYFAWVGHYTMWLLVASIIGICVQVYGLSTIALHQNPSAADTCKETRAMYNYSSDTGTPNNLTFYMCPTCDKQCDFTYLQDECLSMRFNHLFDNPGTMFFAAVMSIWAVLFLEMWKRKQFLLQHRWGMLGYEAAEERPRIHFQRSVTVRLEKARTESQRSRYLRRNPVDPKKMDLVVPSAEVFTKMMIAFSGLLFMVIIVLGIVLSVILYQFAVSAVLYVQLSRLGASSMAGLGSIVASVTGSLVQLVAIMIMGGIYNWLAKVLTTWELHRTQTEHEDSLIAKTYIFQFVNFYSSLFYIAFFKGSVLGYPGAFIRIGSLRSSGCSAYGCFTDLAIQLLVILGGKQIYGNLMEIGLPIAKRLIKQYLSKRAEKEEKAVYSSWDRDFDLEEVSETGFLSEYLELVIQYGFVTLFVAVFPLAPLLALLNNWVEIRLDAYKYIVTTRRPVAERAQDIGAWYAILEFVSKLAVVTNAFLIAVTSDVLPELVYSYNSNYTEVCSQHDWPSCHVAAIYKGQAGYLDSAAVQYFSIKSMFDDMRGFPVSPGSPPSDPPVPDLSLYSLLAYYPNKTKASFLFLPYLDVDCLNGLAGSSLEYQDLTVSLFQTNSTLRNYVPNCIKDDAATICGFRGYGRNNDGKYPLGFWMNWTVKLAFVIIFEHVIFVVVAVIAWIIPDVPEKVKLEMIKEVMLASEAQLKQKEREEEEEKEEETEEKPAVAEAAQ